MFWQASAACASCGASMLVRPLPGLTATRLACTAGWGLGRGTGGGWGRGPGLRLPYLSAHIGDGRPSQGQ